MQHEVDDDDGRDDQKLSGGSVTRYRARVLDWLLTCAVRNPIDM